MSRILKIGDKVMWRGSFGAAAPQVAEIESIEVCANDEKYGRNVSEAAWDCKEKLTVNLTNGSWAYGSQISPMQ